MVLIKVSIPLFSTLFPNLYPLAPPNHIPGLVISDKFSDIPVSFDKNLAHVGYFSLDNFDVTLSITLFPAVPRIRPPTVATGANANPLTNPAADVPTPTPCATSAAFDSQVL